MPKLQESQNRFFITLPSKIVRLVRWQKGDHIVLETDLKGKLYLIKRESEN